MKKLIRAALFATVLVGGPATAEETLLDCVVDACEDDVSLSVTLMSLNACQRGNFVRQVSQTVVFSS